MENFLWWQEGVIYQIYVRSFADGNGDGLGDLAGIRAHLEALASLGIDAIWLTPIQPSPDADFGYDCCDYCAVDLRYGSLAEFDHLVEDAHRNGIRVILDMVMNHTSDQHAWFRESRSSRTNPKRDWYIWRDRPNNWQAAFGGKAWEYDAVTGQYYLHLFTKEQPDLNWRNPDVRRAMLQACRFWLERGVDGFRLDVFNAYFKHPDLADNPAKFGLRGFDRQRHIHDIDQPEMLPLLQELRALLDAFPERFAVGETYLVTAEKAASYCGPQKLHVAFSFDFTAFESEIAEALQLSPWKPDWLREKIRIREEAFSKAGLWPTTVLSNHDLPRAASRYARGEEDAKAKIAMALLLTLRGTPFLYYGEEIGMRNLRLHRKEILDPAGKKYWPIYPGRDICRSPMQWSDEAFAGFSRVQPWLRVNPDYPHRNVEAQKADPESLLNFTRRLIRLRKEHAALRRGDLTLLESGPAVLAYLRATEEQTVLVALNFKSRAEKLSLPSGDWQVLFSNNGEQGGANTPLALFEVRLLVKAFS